MENEALALPSPQNLRLVALDPAQLQQSQKQLIAWCNQKMDIVSAEIAEFRENLRIAKESKWNTIRPKAAVRYAEGRLTFYEKIRDALEAGYFIVPNFPCDVFAIRTERDPGRADRAEVDTYSTRYLPRPNESELPSSGDGEYVSPTPKAEFLSRKFKDGDKERYENVTTITGWKDPDFPFVLAKPEVLSATQRAMALKIFDEMGVCPQTKKSDPLVVGIIKGPKRGYTQKQVTFLAAWFLDTDVL